MTDQEEIQFFAEEEVPRGHVAGRTPLPRKWLKTLREHPKEWGLIEQYEDPKKAAGRANSHRIWAEKQHVPIEVISRTLPGNWQDDHSIADPTPSEGFVFARWVGPAKKTQKRRKS